MSEEDTTLTIGNAKGEKLTIPVPKGARITIATPALHYNRKRLLSGMPVLILTFFSTSSLLERSSFLQT